MEGCLREIRKWPSGGSGSRRGGRQPTSLFVGVASGRVELGGE
jgi:hypothetical protein